MRRLYVVEYAKLFGSLDLIERHLAIKSFPHFVKYMWENVCPGEELHWNFVQEAICSHLMAVRDGRIRKLIIMIPPRSLKSSLVSVLYPAWVWLHEPRHKFISSSYSMSLSTRDSVKTRDLMKSERYRDLLALQPDEIQWDWSADQDLKNSYVNSMQGHRLSCSTGSAITGYGADTIVVDDPLNAQDAESEAERYAVGTWFYSSLGTRLNNPRKGNIIVIMQRLHPADLVGIILEKQGGKGRAPHETDTNKYTTLCIQQIYESKYSLANSAENPTSIGWIDPRDALYKEGVEYPDERLLASPNRYGVEELNALKRDMGQYSFNAQHMQMPSINSGIMFKADAFSFYTQSSLPTLMPVPGMGTGTSFDQEVLSFDLTFGGSQKEQALEIKTKGSFAVGHCWARKGNKFYLLEERRGKWTVPESEAQILQMHQDYPRATILIEAKAAGIGVIEMLKDRIPGIIGINPKGSKIDRAMPLTNYVQNIHLPHPSMCGWVAEWITEVSGFPAARRDDRVDAMSMALNWLTEQNNRNSSFLDVKW